ncbi:MAG: hypothetical protein SFY66_08720 [Oculatellaceae cyanobacterium bins.114]|nr:hypothetical protein [Oculatellaceae cyanobacterium bins.114]
MRLDTGAIASMNSTSRLGGDRTHTDTVEVPGSSTSQPLGNPIAKAG